MRSAGHPVETVLGPRDLAGGGVVDAHAHAWIDRVPGGASDGPVLDDEPAVRAELTEFAAAGGRALMDCQPPGVGRDVRRLVALAAATGVDVVACTGFHLRRYYPDGPSTWTLGTDAAAERFLTELSQGVAEWPDADRPVRAGAVKVAHPGHPDHATSALLDAAVAAARVAGVMLVVHTERGAAVEGLADELLRLDVSSQDVMLCHVDKRADLGVHRALAEAGFLLEYDTFVRDRYAPADNVWPLLVAMVDAGHAESVSCGSDLADHSLWRFGGDGTGPAGFVEAVRTGLAGRGVDARTTAQLLGGNVVDRLRRAGMRGAAG